VDVGVGNALGGQGLQILRPRLERHELMILRRVVLVVVTRFGLDVIQNTGVDYGRADQASHGRIARDFLAQGNEPAVGQSMMPVTLCHIHVIALLEETEPNPSWIREPSQGMDPPRADSCGSAGGMIELATGI